MSAENVGFAFGKWQQINATCNSAIAKEISQSRTVLKKMILNSHTSGTFRLANGTATNYTPIGGTYTPATGSSVIEFGEMDAFPNGCVMVMAGTIDSNVTYNTLP